MTHGSIVVTNAATAVSDASFTDHAWRDGVVARRNVLVGLWAAARLGLAGAEAEAYAWSVHFADFDAPGHDDVVAKVSTDLAAAGVAASDATIRDLLREMQARAELHLAAEAR